MENLILLTLNYLVSHCHLSVQEGIQYNLHQVCGVLSDTALSGITAPHTQEFGSALFPTLLLLNHSCNTNTLRINIDGNKVIKCIFIASPAV